MQVSPEAMMAAWKDGEAAGRADTQIGANFRSAMVAADHEGYPRTGIGRDPLRRCFIDGYLFAIPVTGVVTDAEGRVVRH